MKFLIKLFLLFVLSISVQAQDFPEPMSPPRLVNDFASMFTPEEQGQLERMLVNYTDTTSTEIAVVTVPSLNGYEINDYATRLFNKWGIGGSKNNNGVLILIKPKTAEEKGQAYIAPGYGMEGVLPDVLCNRIVDNEMVPRLRDGRNAEAVAAAVNIMFNLAKGSYTADQYMKKTSGKKKKDNSLVPIIIIFAIVLIISAFGGRGGGRNLGSKGELPLWILLSLLNSAGGRGSFGGFSSGGGGFGGFGGGRSGGGGAGGSW